MSIDLREALHTYIVESRELLDQMEEGLISLKDEPDSPETINAVFRAIHTIKGSAGLFGLTDLVAFTHVAESALDLIRAGELVMTPPAIALFLSVADHIGGRMHNVEHNLPLSDEQEVQCLALMTKLNDFLGRSGTEQAAASAVKGETVAEQGALAQSKDWHISMRCGTEVLRDGMDPLAIVRYLGTLGTVERIILADSDLTPERATDPEVCHLGFDLRLSSTQSASDVEGAFEFVQDSCRVTVIAPNAPLRQYRDLMDVIEFEGGDMGVLVACGSLTEAEAAACLAPVQQVSADPSPSLAGQATSAKSKTPRDEGGKKPTGGSATLIRVNAEKVDQHINLIGELIIASAQVSTLALRSGASELMESASQMSRLVEEVRDSALGLRMVPIGATFNKFQRVVHDVSHEIGKDIRLEIFGADTELDKTVVEKISDPLTHLVRNSMDHGIEHAEDRLKAGKPAHGTITFNAYHDSGSIVIEVSDDGGGLNRDRIRAKALEKGLIYPEQNLTDAEICNLIFEPGFSTAATINNLSGRGVGMDVVKKNITALRGSLDIDSVEGKGTTMRIRLPLTLAIIDGFLVGVANQTFVVPLEMVVECVELSDDAALCPEGNQINLRGEVLPYIRLREMFDVPQFGASDKPRRENVVVVTYAGKRAGLVVDALHGEFQTVIRPLGNVFAGLQGVSGFTILGSGLVALIVDVPGLVKRVIPRQL